VATELSSRSTPFYKFVLPVLLVGGMGAAALTAYRHPESLNGPTGWSRDYAWVMMITLGAVMASAVWWFAGRLMRVELDDDELVISNYRTEIRVRLSHVVKIDGPTITNPPRYTLTFDEPTDFGRRVTFTPRRAWSLLPRGEADVVVELRAAWEAARRGRDQ
jgi:hypothetical protein